MAPFLYFPEPLTNHRITINKKVVDFIANSIMMKLDKLTSHRGVKMKKTYQGRPLTSFAAFFTLILSSCAGGGTATNFDLFKADIAANGGPISLGTFNANEVLIGEDDDFGEEKLYASVYFQQAINRQRLGGEGEDYIVLFLEDDEGECAKGDVAFTFKTNLDIDEGTASELTSIVDLEGTSTSVEQEEAQEFVDFVASEMSDFIEEVDKNNTQTESNIITILENHGYAFNTYDQETYDYLTSKIKTDYGIDVNVMKLYQGYIGQYEDFTQVIVLKNVEQATALFYARRNTENEIGYYFRSNNVLVYSASQTTINWITP